MGTLNGRSVAATPGPEWRQRLRSAGLRVTQPRLAVLEAVQDDPHLAADQVSDRVRERIGTVSTQAVYDALNTLTDHQILRRIEPAGSSMLFEINAGDNHHHIVCRSCGAIADVPCSVGAAPCTVPQQAQGFIVEEAEITYWGLCADCSADRGRRNVTRGDQASADS